MGRRESKRESVVAASLIQRATDNIPAQAFALKQLIFIIAKKITSFSAAGRVGQGMTAGWESPGADIIERSPVKYLAGLRLVWLA